MENLPVRSGTSVPALFVVILNWNRPQYTLACLESVLRSDFANLRIIVVDNGSTDNSWEAMRSWEAGGCAAPLCLPEHLQGLIATPQRSNSICAFLDKGDDAKALPCAANVMFVRRQVNGGYAAGNNTGIRLALQLGADYVWILNNDTLVEPSAAGQIVKYMLANPEIGLCGCTIRAYDQPTRLLALSGSHFNRWTGRSHPVLFPTDIPKGLSYIEGASVSASRDFLSQIGLLCEEYFLFCEEIDWAIRAEGKFALGYCEAAVIYHKRGTRPEPNEDSFRIYCSDRAHLLLARKHWLVRFPTVLLSMMSVALVQAIRGNHKKALATLCAVANELGLQTRPLHRALGFSAEQLQAIERCRKSALAK